MTDRQTRLATMALIFLILIGRFSLGVTVAKADTRPNIILCMGDDHGWDETGYYGHPYLHTPVLDAMAAQGLRLDRFYAASPVCSPTRGSVLTGRHPNRYGTFSANWSIRPEEISIAQILNNAGYACGHFGKWHVGPVKADSPTNPGALGFDEWISHDNFFEMDPQLSRNGGPPELFEGESSEILIEETIRFIDRVRQKSQPFFAVVWFGSPHEPYSGWPHDLARYDHLPARYPDQQVTITSMETGLQVRRPVGDVLRERYAEITAMDRAMGRLRAYLKQEGLRDNTLLWYCSDNGSPPEGMVTMPLRGRKGMVYEGGVRVPSVIEWPARISEPRISTVNAVTSDILPTLCDLAGVPADQRALDRPLDGISLQPLFEGRMQQRPTPICFWHFRPGPIARRGHPPWIDPELQEGTTPLVKLINGRATRNFVNYHYPKIHQQDFEGARAVLEGRYKLVIEGGQKNDPPRELFDLQDDPAETKNLIDAHPEIARRLEQHLQSWQQSVLESLTGADYR